MGAPVEPEMETVVVTRGIKVLACLMGLISTLLLITTTGSTAWALEGNEFPYTAHGLFQRCQVSKVPKEDQEKQGVESFICGAHDDVPTWLLACQVLMVVAIVVTFASLLTVAIGLCSAVEGCKFGSYRAGIYGYFISVFVIIITGILYPIKFFQDNEGDHFTLGWSYGLAWGLSVILLVGALMLILDKGEELTLREKMPEEEEEA